MINITIDSVDRFSLFIPIIKKNCFNKLELGKGKYLYREIVVNRNYYTDGIDNYFIGSNYWKSIYE